MIEIFEHEIKDFQKSLLQLQSNFDKITSSPAQKCLYNHQAEGKLNSLDQNVSDLNSKFYPLSQKIILLEEKFSSLSHDISNSMDLERFGKSFAQKLLNLECNFKTSQQELSSHLKNLAKKSEISQAISNLRVNLENLPPKSTNPFHETIPKIINPHDASQEEMLQSLSVLEKWLDKISLESKTNHELLFSKISEIEQKIEQKTSELELPKIEKLLPKRTKDPSLDPLYSDNKPDIPSKLSTQTQTCNPSHKLWPESPERFFSKPRKSTTEDETWNLKVKNSQKRQYYQPLKWNVHSYSNTFERHSEERFLPSIPQHKRIWDNPKKKSPVFFKIYVPKFWSQTAKNYFIQQQIYEYIANKQRGFKTEEPSQTRKSEAGIGFHSKFLL